MHPLHEVATCNVSFEEGGISSIWMTKTSLVNRQLAQSLNLQFNLKCCISLLLGIDFLYSSL